MSKEDREIAIGSSRQFRIVRKCIEIVAPTGNTVVLLGETGTGKELEARRCHALADPSGTRPFLAVNCGALAESLLERELFGCVQGAFTGAGNQAGIFEAANGGTVFLDELGEMSENLRAKLLRVLGCGEVVRVGSTKPVKVKVRIIVATSKDIQKAVEDGSFHKDLYYRIDVNRFTMPTLRERGAEDICLLAEYFVRRYCTEQGVSGSVKITREAFEALAAYDYPGNVRELRNIVYKAMPYVLHEGRFFRWHHLAFHSLPLLENVGIDVDMDKIYDALLEEDAPSASVCPARREALAATIVPGGEEEFLVPRKSRERNPLDEKVEELLWDRDKAVESFIRRFNEPTFERFMSWANNPVNDKKESWNFWWNAYIKNRALTEESLDIPRQQLALAVKERLERMEGEGAEDKHVALALGVKPAAFRQWQRKNKETT